MPLVGVGISDFMEEQAEKQARIETMFTSLVC